MLKLMGMLLCVFSLGFVLISCQRLDQGEGPLPMEQAKVLDAIPLEYGKLVGVTQHREFTGVAVLWFEKPDKSIAAIQVNFVQGKMHPFILNIPRK